MHTGHHFAVFQGRLFYFENQSCFGGRILHRYMLGPFKFLEARDRMIDCTTMRPFEMPSRLPVFFIFQEKGFKKALQNIL